MIIGSQRTALELAGVSRGTWHYRSNPRPAVQDPIHQADRAYECRISTAHHDRILGLILAGWEKGNSVDHAFATAWDNGVLLASNRTWWRIAAGHEDQQARPIIPRKRGVKR
ncbi:hypothetical protein, partial [Arthrobacter ramosus]